MLEWLNSELVKNLTVATISLYGGVVGSNPTHQKVPNSRYPGSNPGCPTTFAVKLMMRLSLYKCILTVALVADPKVHWLAAPDI